MVFSLKQSLLKLFEVFAYFYFIGLLAELVKSLFLTNFGISFELLLPKRVSWDSVDVVYFNLEGKIGLETLFFCRGQLENTWNLLWISRDS